MALRRILLQEVRKFLELWLTDGQVSPTWSKIYGPQIWGKNFLIIVHLELD